MVVLEKILFSALAGLDMMSTVKTDVTPKTLMISLELGNVILLYLMSNSEDDCFFMLVQPKNKVIFIFLTRYITIHCRKSFCCLTVRSL